METAIEAERMEVPIDAQKGFLIYVSGIFRRTQQIHSEPEHTLVVCAHQLLKGVLVAALRRPN
jgi:hypothetical protein